MYVPPHFAETELNRLHAFMEQHSFGLLVSQVEAVPYATHLPFLVDRTAGPHGALVGHMARANPHWRALEAQQALVVFSGPHAYISPSWYEADNVVPTWNYAAVHAYGVVRLVHDKDALLEIVQDAVAFYEASMPQPWSLAADEAFVDRMLAQIVGFRLEIEKLEGKFKLNQNHPAERRKKVAQALRDQGGDNAQAVADMVYSTLAGGE